MKYIIAILLTALIAFSCKNDETIEAKEVAVVQVTPAPVVSQDPEVQNMIKMLQGTWNSQNDKNTSITFENNTRIETKDGEALGKVRYFEIADQCNNDTARGKKIVKSKAKYISLQDIDMCYYIKRITKNELVLSYVGRNNTLIYIKDSAPSQRVNKQGKPEIATKKSKK